jgi:hypothetical protein
MAFQTVKKGNCKMQIANCKLKATITACVAHIAVPQNRLPIFNLHFAICIFHLQDFSLRITRPGLISNGRLASIAPHDDQAALRNAMDKVRRLGSSQRFWPNLPDLDDGSVSGPDGIRVRSASQIENDT